MEIPEDHYGLQASVLGSLGPDNLAELNLEEIFDCNDTIRQIENGFCEDNANGNINLGFSIDQSQLGQLATQAYVDHPGVMFSSVSGSKYMNDGYGQLTGQPIDIPRLRSQQQPLPLTPPYSDGPDSPIEEQVQGNAVSIGTIDQRTLATLSTRVDNDQFLGTELEDSAETTSLYLLQGTRCGPEPRRKRKRTDGTDLDITMTNGPLGRGAIKTEPGIMDDLCHDSDSTDSLSNDTSELSSTETDTSYQCLKWKAFKQSQWQDLYDEGYNKLSTPEFKVDADKGFNFSFADDVFVCQKKNHFQITINFKTAGSPKYIQVKDGFKPIEKLRLHMYGIKMESTGSSIRVEQSQADRSKKPYDPAVFLPTNKENTKLTVGRLHFSETTSNNMRKKGKPNPDQRYFNLVVAIHAHAKHETQLICGSASERIIVRASNPGQFENDVEVVWSRGVTTDSVFRMGRVGINTDRPDESLSIHGNMKLTGHVVYPSDMRVKENIEEMDSSEQLRNVSKMKLYRYSYSREYLEVAGLTSDLDTGVLAQEVKEVLPDAVRVSDDVILPDGKTIEKLLVVNKERIFMENVGAVKELCKLTDKLEIRIDELEMVSKKLQSRRRADTSSSCFSSISRASSFSRTASMCSKKSTTSSHEGEKTTKHSHHRYDHHTHRHNCHQQRRQQEVLVEEQAWCTPRFMQFLIIVLVLVMCLSIGAMATLYIMQDKKQTGFPGDTSEAFERPEASGIPYFNTTPSSFVTPSNGSINSTTGPPDTRSTSSPRLPVITLSSFTPTGSKSSEGIVTSKSITATPPNTTRTTQIPTQIHSTLPQQPQQPSEYQATTTAKAPKRVCNCCGQNEKCKSIPSNVLTGKAVYYEMNNMALPQGTPQTAPSQEYKLRITEKNYKLNCDSCSFVNSTFYVPYSAGVPFQAMTLELNSTAKTMMLLCANNNREECPEQTAQPQYDTNLAKDSWSTLHRWRLPAAFYFWSSFHFRVVKPGNSSHIHEADCSTNQGQGLSDFTDLHFHFIRVCKN